MNRILLLALALALVAATTASAASPRFTNRMVTVKVSGSMKTTWQATPVPDQYCENKPTGARGSGTEDIEWSNARAIKGQLTGAGNSWGLMLFDKKNKPTFELPISGTVRRSGSGVSVACGEEGALNSDGCTGLRGFDTKAQLSFMPGGRFTLDDNGLTMSQSLFTGCKWIWNSMVVRVGDVLINIGAGKFDGKRLAGGRSSVTLKTHDEQLCQNQLDPDEGVQCKTVTDWRITFYPAKKTRRR